MCCDADEAYDRYRDMWTESLTDALRRVYEDFVKPVKHGYYSGATERFVEHSIQTLGEITNCNVRANDGNIIVVKREIKQDIDMHDVEVPVHIL